MAKKLKSKGFKPIGVDAYGKQTEITNEVFGKKQEAVNAVESGQFNWGADFIFVEVFELTEVEEKGGTE